MFQPLLSPIVGTVADVEPAVVVIVVTRLESVIASKNVTGHDLRNPLELLRGEAVGRIVEYRSHNCCGPEVAVPFVHGDLAIFEVEFHHPTAKRTRWA